MKSEERWIVSVVGHVDSVKMLDDLIGLDVMKTPVWADDPNRAWFDAVVTRSQLQKLEKHAESVAFVTISKDRL